MPSLPSPPPGLAQRFPDRRKEAATEFFESRRHSDLSCSSSLENRKPQANDGNIREFCSGGGGDGSLFLLLPLPSPPLLLLLLLPSGAFSPAYKREYTAVPLRPGGSIVYVRNVYSRLARSLAAGQKRDPYILADRKSVV